MKRKSGRVFRRILGSPRKLADGRFLVILECRHQMVLTRVRDPSRALCRDCVLEAEGR